MTPTRQSAIHRALGDAFLKLPAEVRDAHDNGGSLRLSGAADVWVKPGLLPRLVCWAVGLPRAGASQPVSVDFFTDKHGVDRWVRNFSGRVYKSTFTAEPGGNGRVIERLGVFTIEFALAAEPGRLVFDIAGMKALGLPLPRFLAVACHAEESGDDGAFLFDIAIGMGVLGEIIRYRGRLR
jgi:hypothetical protein